MGENSNLQRATIGYFTSLQQNTFRNTAHVPLRKKIHISYFVGDKNVTNLFHNVTITNIAQLENHHLHLKQRLPRIAWEAGTIPHTKYIRYKIFNVFYYCEPLALFRARAKLRGGGWGGGGGGV